VNDADSTFLAWQLADSAFPTGAFAHSWGLEAAWQHGEIPDARAVRRFVDAAVQQTAYAVVPLMNAAFQEPRRWAELDALADAFLTNAVANRASRQQGRTLLATASRVWPAPQMDRLRETGSRLCAHLGPVTGVAFESVGVSLPTARQLMLFAAARGVLSAAVRLGILGSYEAQRLQLECVPVLERCSAQSAGFDEGDLVQVAPIADLFQATHDRLYSRLFQS
jgi:urease accessory protein